MRRIIARMIGSRRIVRLSSHASVRLRRTPELSDSIMGLRLCVHEDRHRVCKRRLDRLWGHVLRLEPGPGRYTCLAAEYKVVMARSATNECQSRQVGSQRGVTVA